MIASFCLPVLLLAAPPAPRNARVGGSRRLRRRHGEAARRASSPTRRARRRSSRDRQRSPFFRLAERRLALPLGEEPVGGRRRASSSRRYDDAAWDTLPVPSNWQVVGANESRPYDRPFFTNIKHPFKADPPRVPHDDNPVGLYRTRFEVPAEWKGRRVFVHFAGVQSAYYVWLNGAEARLPGGRLHAGRVRPDARTCGRGRTCSRSR